MVLPNYEGVESFAHQLAFSESEKDRIKSAIPRINSVIERHPSVGIVFSHVFAVDLGEGLVVCLKKSRSASVDTIERDILQREQTLLVKGVSNFAPSIRIGNYIVQRWIKNSISHETLTQFLEFLKTKGIGLANSGDNVRVTETGDSVIIDVINT